MSATGVPRTPNWSSPNRASLASILLPFTRKQAGFLLFQTPPRHRMRTPETCPQARPTPPSPSNWTPFPTHDIIKVALLVRMPAKRAHAYRAAAIGGSNKKTGRHFGTPRYALCPVQRILMMYYGNPSSTVSARIRSDEISDISEIQEPR